MSLRRRDHQRWEMAQVFHERKALRRSFSVWRERVLRWKSKRLRDALALHHWAAVTQFKAWRVRDWFLSQQGMDDLLFKKEREEKNGGGSQRDV